MHETPIVVVWKAPGDAPIRRVVTPRLETLKGLVGGGYLEQVSVYFATAWGAALRFDLWCDEDGLRSALPPNLVIDGQVIVGPVFVAKRSGPEIVGLSDAEVIAACAGLERAAVKHRP